MLIFHLAPKIPFIFYFEDNFFDDRPTLLKRMICLAVNILLVLLFIFLYTFYGRVLLFPLFPYNNKYVQRDSPNTSLSGNASLRLTTVCCVQQ
jgi:hypothetical protein